MTTEQVWRDFSKKLLGFIRSKVANETVADDLMQEVFIKIHQQQTSLSQKENLMSWLYTITRNTIIDYYRKKKIPQKSIDTELLKIEEAFHNESFEFSECLAPFIDQLADPYKEALLATSFAGIPQKEYASTHNLSYSTVKSRVQRARKQLKDLFSECCAVQVDKYGNILDADTSSCKKC